MKEIVILGGARTPIGSFLGALSSFSAPKLGSVAIKCALENSGVRPEQVQQVLMGNVLQGAIGQAPARQAGIGAGIPVDAGAVTINKVCGSGLKAVMYAANDSKIKDGAAALVVTSAEYAEQHGLKPMARILAQGTAAQEPEWFTTAPAKAIDIVLRRAGLSVDDIDLFEINEAFAAVALAAMADAKIPHEKMNVHGGAVALGHPIGASGARILVTLLHALQDRNLKRGMAAICIGGGEAAAMIVERL